MKRPKLIDIKQIPKFSDFYSSALMRQILHFFVVGTAAASVHIGIVICLVQLQLMHPLAANVIAFLCSFNVSYLGHHYLTFSKIKVPVIASLPRFFTVAVMSFVLNEVLFYYFLKIFYYPVALVLVLLIVALLTFSCSKIWAFANAKNNSVCG